MDETASRYLKADGTLTWGLMRPHDSFAQAKTDPSVTDEERTRLRAQESPSSL